LEDYLYINITHNFHELYTHYYQRAWKFTKSYIHDSADAEDIVSEELIKLWELLQDPQKKQIKNTLKDLDLMLLCMLKNKALDYLRHQKVKADAEITMAEIGQRELYSRISSLQACDPEIVLSHDIERIVKQTLDTMPLITRRVFELSRYKEKKNKEIAIELNMSVKNVEHHTTKALKTLRAALKDYLPSCLFLFLF